MAEGTTKPELRQAIDAFGAQGDAASLRHLCERFLNGTVLVELESTSEDVRNGHVNFLVGELGDGRSVIALYSSFDQWTRWCPAPQGRIFRLSTRGVLQGIRRVKPDAVVLDPAVQPTPTFEPDDIEDLAAGRIDDLIRRSFPK